MSKSFGPLLALSGVDLSCYAGEVHSVLGENGAGKSTLMKVIAGVISADAGEMTLGGQRYQPSSPKHAMRCGVGMVHQDYRLVQTMTVADNVLLGWDRAPRIGNEARTAALVAELGSEYGLDVNPRAGVGHLSIGEQQRVAILRALVRGARVLILDEPTAALTPQESDRLFGVMRQLAADGRAVIFISHKLREVMNASSRVTVLRAGKRVAALQASECDERSLANLMVGRDVTLPANPRKNGSPRHATVMRAESLRVRDDRGVLTVDSASLSVAEHEILGLAGVAGNGQRELSEVLTGMRPPESGRIFVADQELTGSGSKRFIRAGVGHIPEDRLATGMILRETITRNAIMKAVISDGKYSDVRWGPWLRLGGSRRLAMKLLEEGMVDLRDPSTQVGNLSGGNIQRFLVARELRAARRMLVAVHPTQGLDIGATERVWRLLLAARDSGVAVLLISEDLDEVLSLSDRIQVLYEGRLLSHPGKDIPSREQVGLMMGGSRIAAGSTATTGPEAGN